MSYSGTRYAGVAFDVFTVEGMMVPFAGAARWAETPIPNTDYTDLQWLGSETPTLTVTALLYNSADLATLMAARGVTRRTLYQYGGQDYPYVQLKEVANPRVYFSECRVDLTFYQATAT